MLKSKTFLSEILAATIILLFVYTATSKFLNYHSFVNALSKSTLINSYSTSLAPIIPTSEYVISIFLFVPRYRLIGFVMATFSMFCFTLYIAYMLLFTPDLPCSCGGVLQGLGWKEHLIFNICFMVLSALGWAAERKVNLKKTNILLQ